MNLATFPAPARRWRGLRTARLASALAAALLFVACGPSTPSAALTSTPAAAPSGTLAPAGSPGASPGATAATSPGGSPGSALACTAPATATVSQTEGPYYKAGAPQKSNLVESGMTGTPLTLTGFVVDTSCRPMANAKVDVWQADADGQYDNSGYRLRGYVLTDASGRYTIETVIPGQYPGRTEHIHVKVTPAGGSTLTSQLYFPDQPNATDAIFDPSLVLTMAPSGSSYVGTFTFVLRA